MELRGTRTVLSALEPEDLDFMCDIECDPSIWAFEERTESDREKVRVKYQAEANSAHHHNFVVRRVGDESAEPIGIIQLWSYSEFRKSWELGFALLPEHRGRGYGAEAARLLLGFAFEALGAHKVVGMCHCDNAASARLMEAAGLVREGVFKEELLIEGNWHDQYFYSILEKEFG